MADTDRRNVLRAGLALASLPHVALLMGCGSEPTEPSEESELASDSPSDPDESSAAEEPENESTTTTEPTTQENAMQIQYLEIVTPDVDAICGCYEKAFGISFGESDPSLGGARTATMTNGGMLGVRAPMRETETPVVRPYVLVEDIQSAVDAAAEAGAEVAIPPMELPGHGKFAIVIQGGIESGFWQN